MDFKTRYQYNPKTDLIGKGGFSKVFRAKDTSLLDRVVALKVFNSDVAGKYDIITEIKKVIDLDHQNICRYYDVEILNNTNAMGEEEHIQVGVLEYLDGGDLRTYVKNNPGQLSKLLIDVLAGLSYLHHQGIIHRDLKPANILVKNTPQGPIAKIIDFGISKNIESDNNPTSSLLLGSVKYMAPEQFVPGQFGINGKIDTNIDLWSFGLMVYEFVTDEEIFDLSGTNGNTAQIMQKILSEEINETKLKALPYPYGAIVDRCLKKDANQRVKDAAELISILQGQTIQQAPFVEHKASEKTQVIRERQKEVEAAARQESPLDPEKQYEQLWADATAKFESGNYFDALELYKQASALFPSRRVVKSRIAICQKRLDSIVTSGHTITVWAIVGFLLIFLIILLITNIK